jgi:dihydrofolate synthase/folylpolyglutamate synthase
LGRPENRAFDSYRSCLDWLFARHRFVSKPGLDRVRWLLGAVDSPHERFDIVHVAGTNGKGSTASMISSVLAEHGLRTGLYMSPHVVDFSERISVSGQRIAQERVVDLIDRLKPAADEIDATFFEITTAAAALYFAEERADIVVAEVGLGGRLDATNALNSVLSVITTVAIDHAEVLGSDTASIAAEKSGIIREAGTVVAGAKGVALDVIRGVAAARKARFVPVDSERVIGRASATPSGNFFDFEHGGTRLEGLSVSMLGRHQIANAATALVAVLELGRGGVVGINERSIRAGLADASCTGRMQIIDRRPTVIADVAHNPDGARVLSSSLEEIFRRDRTIAVVGIMGDKDVRGILAALAQSVDVFVFTKPATERAADPESLAEIAGELGIEAHVVPTPGAAVENALSRASEGDLVLITGSHYTVGDVMISLGLGGVPDAA